MKVCVMNRNIAVGYCHCENMTESIMISISDPWTRYTSAPFVSEKNKVRSILRLEFEDVDSGDNSMTQADAKRICNFLRYSLRDKNTGEERMVIVQCDAGRSRSAGVAAAILKYYNGDDSEIFDWPLYNPNMHCYRMTLNTLMQEEPGW